MKTFFILILTVFGFCYGIESCPFGHKKLQEIPIIYGLLPSDPEISQKIKMREIWWGGCVSLSSANDELKTICEICQYALSQDGKYWEKSSEGKDDFNFELSEFSKNFPTPEVKDLSSKIIFNQNIFFDSKIKLQKEKINFWAKKSFDKMDILGYLEEGKFSVQYKGNSILATNAIYEVLVKIKETSNEDCFHVVVKKVLEYEEFLNIYKNEKGGQKE